MTNTITRSYSRLARQALSYLGSLVRAGRIEKKMSMQELAERAGISRDMLYRIEKGDPRCEIGVVFELAAIVGIPWFDADTNAIQARHQELSARLALMPKAVHSPRKDVVDDF